MGGCAHSLFVKRQHKLSATLHPGRESGKKNVPYSIVLPLTCSLVFCALVCSCVLFASVRYSISMLFFFCWRVTWLAGLLTSWLVGWLVRCLPRSVALRLVGFSFIDTQLFSHVMFAVDAFVRGVLVVCQFAPRLACLRIFHWYCCFTFLSGCSCADFCQ